MLRTKVAIAVTALVIGIAAFTPHASAQAGNPTLSYLQSVIQPALAALASQLTAVQTTVNTTATDAASAASGISAANLSLSTTPSVFGVPMVLSTQPGTMTIQNIDVAARSHGFDFPFEKIKRYTVTIDSGDLAGAAVNVDRVTVADCVLDLSNICFEKDVVFFADLSASAAQPFSGFVNPYAGTNSFIRIIRGADGLGAVDVRVNAYLEMAR